MKHSDEAIQAAREAYSEAQCYEDPIIRALNAYMATVSLADLAEWIKEKNQELAEDLADCGYCAGYSGGGIHPNCPIHNPAR